MSRSSRPGNEAARGRHASGMPCGGGSESSGPIRFAADVRSEPNGSRQRVLVVTTYWRPWPQDPDPERRVAHHAQLRAKRC